MHDCTRKIASSLIHDTLVQANKNKTQESFGVILKGETNSGLDCLVVKNNTKSDK